MAITSTQGKFKKTLDVFGIAKALSPKAFVLTLGVGSGKA